MNEKIPRIDELSGFPVVIPMGVDEAGNYDNARTDPNRIIWVRQYEGYMQVDPVEIPVVEADVWNPGTAGAQIYLVEFLVVNNTAAPGAAVTGVYVGLDIGGVGALGAPDYWMFDETIPYPGSSGWRGPFVVNGNDDVRAVAFAANVCSINWRIRRVDLAA